MIRNISLIILGIIIGFLMWTLYNMVDNREGIITLRDTEIRDCNVNLANIKKQYTEVKLDRDNLYELYEDEKINKRWDQMRNFDTLKELKNFLIEDKTNGAMYIENTYDCDNFAITLQENAAKKGYRISFQIDANAYEIHMYNTAIIEQPRKRVIFIEPQTDEIEEGPYFDEETK